MATPAKHRLSFHMTCPEDNTVDIWGDGAEFIKLSGSDYYAEGVTSMSMGACSLTALRTAFLSVSIPLAADLWPLLRSWEAASVCPSAVPLVCMPYR